MCRVCWVVGVLFTLELTAGVHISTQPTTAVRLGRVLQAASISMTVDGDDFALAGPEPEMLIRIKLPADVYLARTWVDFQGVDALGNSHTNEPIYLAASMDVSPDCILNINSDSISIVRAIAFETSIWIAVRQSSSTWLMDPLTRETFAPSPEHPVSFSMGVDARSSWCANAGGEEYCDPSMPLRYPLHANLLANSHRIDAQQPSQAAETLLCVYVDQSALFGLHAFETEIRSHVGDVRTAALQDDIYLGFEYPVDVLGATDYIQILDRPQLYEGRLRSSFQFIDRQTAQTSHGKNGSVAAGPVEIHIDLDTEIGLHPGSWIDFGYNGPLFELMLDDSGEAVRYENTPGFVLARGSVDLPGFVLLAANVFDTDTVPLTYDCFALYEGPSRYGNHIPISVTLYPRYPTELKTHPRGIAVTTVLYSEPLAYDQPPFETQLVQCSPSYYVGPASEGYVTTHTVSGLDSAHLPSSGSFVVFDPGDIVSFINLLPRPDKVELIVEDSSGQRFEESVEVTTTRDLELDQILASAQKPYVLRWSSSNPFVVRRICQRLQPISSASHLVRSDCLLPALADTELWLTELPKASSSVSLKATAGDGRVWHASWQAQGIGEHRGMADLSWAPTYLDQSVPLKLSVLNAGVQVFSRHPNGYRVQVPQWREDQWDWQLGFPYFTLEQDAVLLFERRGNDQRIRSIYVRLFDVQGKTWEGELVMEQFMESFKLLSDESSVGLIRQRDGQFFPLDGALNGSPVSPVRLRFVSLDTRRYSTSQQRFRVSAWQADLSGESYFQVPATPPTASSSTRVIRSVADGRDEALVVAHPFGQAVSYLLFAFEDDGDVYEFDVQQPGAAVLRITDSGLQLGDVTIPALNCVSTAALFHDSPATYFFSSQQNANVAQVLPTGDLVLDSVTLLGPQTLRFTKKPGLTQNAVIQSIWPHMEYQFGVSGSYGFSDIYRGVTDEQGVTNLEMDDPLKLYGRGSLAFNTHCYSRDLHIEEVRGSWRLAVGGDYWATADEMITRTVSVEPTIDHVQLFWEDDGVLFSQSDTVTLETCRTRPIKVTAYDPDTSTIAESEFWILRRPDSGQSKNLPAIPCLIQR